MTAQPLLLHSLTEFRDLIRSCFETAGVRDVLEIGSESGAFTRELLEFVSDRDGALWCIEPAPTLELEQLDSGEQRFRLVKGRSPEALVGVEACDAYVVDGDHNYWTVSRELEHIHERARAAGRYALVLLHDVSWPCGRRDFYYDPEALPAGVTHALTWTGGAVPGQEQAVEGGYRGNGAFAIAIREGGPRNGVLTAVEDFLAEHEELRLVQVPAVFGLGVVYSAQAPYAGELGELLAPLDRAPLLERLERNRMDLYLRVLELQDSVADFGLRQGRLIAEYDRSLTAAEAELAALRMEHATLREREAPAS